MHQCRFGAAAEQNGGARARSASLESDNQGHIENLAGLLIFQLGVDETSILPSHYILRSLKTLPIGLKYNPIKGERKIGSNTNDTISRNRVIWEAARKFSA